MPNLRGKTWTTTTPAKLEDIQFIEDHLFDEDDIKGGGHLIVNSLGNEMPQRDKLMFKGADVTDEHDKTVVDCKGEKGVGIKSIVKTGTQGLIDTYTITFTDETTTTYQVTNGRDGQDGEDGFSPIAKVTQEIDGATISVTNETGTTTAKVLNGKDGKDGANGQDGTDGITPNIQIGTVTTLEPNEQANATITGTQENPILNLWLPKGKDGSGTGDMMKSVYDTNANGIVDNSEKVNHHTVERNVLADEYSNEEIDNMISGISFEDATTVNGHTVDRNVLADEYTNQQINMLLKSTTKTITIQPSEFVEGVYTLNDDLITETSNQEILPVAYSEENKAMIDAFNAAAFQDIENGQTTGQTKFICTGEVPTIPINIRVIFRGDK